MRRASNGFGLVVIGLGVGWLAGLSVSPVASVVITSALGAAAAIVGALAGVARADHGSHDKPGGAPAQRKVLGNWTESGAVRPIASWPLAVLVVGLVLGSGMGVWARTHNWLGQNPSVRAWSALGVDPGALEGEIRWWAERGVTGLSEDDVTLRLFNLRYPERAADLAPRGPETGADQGVLFSQPSDECNRLSGATDENLFRTMNESPNRLVRAIADLSSSPSKLREVVTIACSRE